MWPNFGQETSVVLLNRRRVGMDGLGMTVIDWDRGPKVVLSGPNHSSPKRN